MNQGKLNKNSPDIFIAVLNAVFADGDALPEAKAMAKIPKITVASKTLIFFQRFLVKRCA